MSQITQQLLAPAGSAPNLSSQPFNVTTAIGYDAAGRVTSVIHTPDAITLPGSWPIQAIIGPLNASYSYDANGNRSQASYQNFGGAGGTLSLLRSFSLNANNNRIEAVSDTRTSTSGTQTTSRTLVWDASGKLTSDGENTYSRDPAGRIQAISNLGSGVTRYQTNLLGQRVRKQYAVAGGTQSIDTVYGESDLMAGLESYPLGSYGQPTSSQAPDAEYLYLPTAQGPMPMAVQIGANLYAIHTDHLNTPRRLTDSNGNPVWQWAITAFGELEPTTAATGWIRERLGSAGPISNTQAVSFNLRYPGQQFDSETGLFYNHNRYYDSYLTVGYTEADPLGLQAGWNRFTYVGANPLGAVDPAGLQSTAACANPANAPACAAAGMYPNIGKGAAALQRLIALLEALSKADNGDNDPCKDSCQKAKADAKAAADEVIRRLMRYLTGGSQRPDAGHFKAIPQAQNRLRATLGPVRRYCIPLPPQYPIWEILADFNIPRLH